MTRNKAQAIISLGLVIIDGKIAKKSSLEVTSSNIISLIEDKNLSWVSRSAGKLDSFLDECGRISLKEKRALDVGSSTGGFTQVLLERGILSVDSVDVGTNQLAEILKRDPRVTSYEQTDIREYCKNYSHTKKYDIIVGDVSFISLGDIIDAILSFAHQGTEIFLLFKPQFEVGKKNLRKTGVPKSETIIQEAMFNFEQLLNHKCLKIQKKSLSSVIGEAGNREWMYFLQREEGM